MSIHIAPEDSERHGLLRRLEAAERRNETLQHQIQRLIAERSSIHEQIASQEMAIREERNRMAEEIHDGVAQNLALLLLKMEIISRLADSDPLRMKMELGKVVGILESSVQELRGCIHALRSGCRGEREYLSRTTETEGGVPHSRVGDDL